MAVVHRDLPDRTREGHRQLAGRVVIAKQYIGNCITAFSPRKPGFQNRISLLIFFHQRQRTPIHQHQHQRFTGGFQRRNQVTLALRNSDIGPAGGFVRHPLCFTDHSHHHIRLFRGLHRFINHLLRRARIDFDRFFILIQEIDNAFVTGNVRPFGIQHFTVFTDGIFNPGQYGHGLIGNTGCGPAAHHVTFTVRQWPNHRNGGRFFQR